MQTNRPVVLSFSGHDPSGGAGIQADIEAIVSQQCHSLSVITALTEQDTHNVRNIFPQPTDQILRLTKTILADVPVNAFKIGLLGHPDTVLAIHEIITQYPSIPVVLDPVLAAGGGKDLSDDSLIKAINEWLLPYTTVLTPNSDEARRLTGLEDLIECGLSLLQYGCKNVLITGSHEATPDVHNLLFQAGRHSETYHWDRLPYHYHGSGCTLAASIAALISQGLDITDAIAEAQDFTWNALNAAYQPGKGQHIPNRLFWLDE